MDVANSVDFNETLKRRLGLIQQQGVEATNSAKQQEYNRRAAAQAAQQEQYNSMLQDANNKAYAFTPQGPQPAAPHGRNFDSFLNAITSQESGGNYGAVNKDSGALGRYQVLPTNVRDWAKEAGLGNISTNQFLHSPEIQNRVARFKLQQYYNMYGPAGAAVAWYAGPGRAKEYVNAGGRGFDRPQGNYPSIASYAQSILKKMGY